MSLRMQDDGNLVLYQHAASWVALSASNTAGQTGRPPAPDGRFVYDGHYKRVKQTINGETIYSVYSLSGAILYRDNATTGVTTDYIRLGSKTIARIKGADEVSYLHQDHLGSPVAATDPSGNVLWREAFTPFGETLENPLANKDNESFTGHIKDDATGLTYMQARYYNPVIGRFLSNDPVGFAVGGTLYFNKYAYVGNDPVNNTDPTGMSCTGSRITNDNGTCRSTGGNTTGLGGVAQGTTIDRISSNIRAQATSSSGSGGGGNGAPRNGSGDICRAQGGTCVTDTGLEKFGKLGFAFEGTGVQTGEFATLGGVRINISSALVERALVNPLPGRPKTLVDVIRNAAGFRALGLLIGDPDRIGTVGFVFAEQGTNNRFGFEVGIGIGQAQHFARLDPAP